MKHFITIPKITIISLLISSLFTGCVKQEYDLDNMEKQTWDPNLAMPLIYSSLTVEDVITDQGQNGTIQVDANNLCYIIYKGNLASFKAADIISIPPQTYGYDVMLTAGQIAALTGSSTVTVSFSQTISFNGGSSNPSIDSLIYKSGLLTDSIRSDFKQDATVKITIPRAKKGGVAFSQTLNLDYQTTVPVIAKNTIDLSGYTFDMTLGTNSSSQFVINYEVTVNYSGSNAPSTTDKIAIIQTCRNPKFDKLFGYIGQQSLIPPFKDKDTVELSVFKNTLSSGIFTLADPQVKVLISNSFGVPIKAELPLFNSFTPPSSTVAITGVPSPLPVQSPSVLEIGQAKVDSFKLDNSNSNIVTIMANTPRYLIYQMTAQSNPLGNVSQNFVIDSSEIKVDMEVKIPLDGTVKGFIVQDTINDFKFDLSGDDLIVKSMLLRTGIINGFPTDVAIQIYFTDSAFNKIDSLYAPGQIVLPSAAINGSGKVIASTSKTTDTTLDQARIEKLKKGTKLIIKATVSTTNNGTSNVKIYSNYKIDVKMGMQILASLKLN